uniref:1-deoxy-D-xylulose-5-phosphate synthase n=1 Tax=Kalanchoe fedtschenkoi TaxID=63787 RepID=A0A7N0UU38_KALFE
MAVASARYSIGIFRRRHGDSASALAESESSSCSFPARTEWPSHLSTTFHSRSCCKRLGGRMNSLPDIGDFNGEKVPTPILDLVGNPIHLKNLSIKELKQLADEIRYELSFISSKSDYSLRASLAVVDLTIALHYVFHAPVDKLLWDTGEQTYAHKMLTGRRSLMHTLRKKGGLSGYTSRSESDYDAFGAAHGCNSVSAGLGMAIARDCKGSWERVVTIISNESTMAGQSYEAMSNAGYLDSNMIVILNDSRNSLHPKLDEGSKTSINALSSTLSKLQSSKSFRRLREAAKGVTKKIGMGMHELAAKVDEYARGMLGPSGSTLFEELGLYYIGPVDGHNIEDLISVLQEVASLDSMGPVLVHVITKGNLVADVNQKNEVSTTQPEVHAGSVMEPSLRLLQEKFPDNFFDVGMAEQHAVTFSAGLSCGGLKPFCIIPSALLQRTYSQVVHDVDQQKLPVRFAISNAGLAGGNGPVQSGAFDITFMSCLPNMVVMAPSNEGELVDMVATAAHYDDGPICFRYPSGAVDRTDNFIRSGLPLEIGRGTIVAEGKDVAFLAYGTMVQNCLKARSLLSELGIEVTVANARFCKPLDIKLLRQLCENHSFLITVEEGSVGGFGSHVAQFIALDGRLDGTVKWRPLTLPDNYVEQASLKEQVALAGLSGHHIAATALSLLGRKREALLLMR